MERIWQNKASFLDKNPQESRDRRSISQDHKSHIDWPNANIILNGENLRAFPLRSGTRQGIFTLTAVIQHSIGSLRLCNQTTQRNKRHPNCPGGGQTFTFADDMILYMENPKDSTKKLLELIHEFSKVAGYKINAQKSVAFLYTNNEEQKEKSRNRSCLQLHQKPKNT